MGEKDKGKCFRFDVVLVKKIMIYELICDENSMLSLLMRKLLKICEEKVKYNLCSEKLYF